MDLKDRKQAENEAAFFYDGAASRLLDIVRGGIVYNTLDELNHARDNMINELQKLVPGAEIVRIKNRFDNPTVSGYRDILINIRMSNGHIAEFRLYLKAFLDIREKEYKTYQTIREIEKKAARAKRKLSQDEINIINTLKQKSRASYDAAFEKALADQKTS